MSNFPTLSILPEFPLEETPITSVIRNDMEANYVHSRQRFTRNRKKYKLTYKNLTSADKILLDTFIYTTTAGGSLSFTWTNPIDSVSHTVLFDVPLPSIISETYGDTFLYSWEPTLIEV